jgi:hypothetical protein
MVKQSNSFELANCSGVQDVYIDTAYQDLIKPIKEQKGILICFCKQVFKDYGQKGFDVLFEDQNKHCSTF